MCACPAVGPRQDSGVMPFCAGMLPSATITASAPTIRFISGLDHTAYTLPVYASQRGLPRYHATLGSGCRHTWPGRTGYPLGSNEKFQRCSHLLPIFPGLAWRTMVETMQGGSVGQISRIAAISAQASSTTEVEAFPFTTRFRAFQSRLLVWSARTTPLHRSPGGISTSKGYPFTWVVIGATQAKPVIPLKSTGESTRPNRDPACS